MPWDFRGKVRDITWPETEKKPERNISIQLIRHYLDIIIHYYVECDVISSQKRV